MYHDPEPGQEILQLGASCRSEEDLAVRLQNLESIEYPFSNGDIYHSHALLENLFRVECFLCDNESLGTPSYCVAVILEYTNGHRASLGECRVGISKYVNVVTPNMLYLKPINEQGFHSGAWFTSSESEEKERQHLGWEGRQLAGSLTWWFCSNVIEIVHSQDTADKQTLNI